MVRVWIAVLAVCLALIACAPDAPTCASPYIANGATCCLDRNDDTTCDTTTGEPQAPTLDCSLCAPQFVTQVEERIVYKYICPDGNVHDTPDACPRGAPSNAELFTTNDEQDENLITTFAARPACRGEHKAAELHLEVTRPPQRVRLLAQSAPEGAFEEIAVIEGGTTIIDDEYYYLGLCISQDCASVTDGTLPTDTTSVVRAVLEYSDGSVTTRDRIIDPSFEGEYGKKSC